MKQKSKALRLGAGLAVVVVLGAACTKANNGSKSGDTSSTSSPATATADYATAYTNVREAYAHMFKTADGLAGAIAKQKNLGETTNKAIDTRSLLDQQLGEHAILAAFAMQKGFDGAKDFQAAADALDKNSVELAGTIGSVYGDPAKDAFLKQWRDHIRMFVDFTVATAKGDDAGRQKALDELSQYKKSFAKFLTENTGLDKDAGLKADAVAGLLQMHVDQLTAALDAYKAKDYAKTYSSIKEAFEHMFKTGDGLSAAIAKQKNLGETTGKGADTRILLEQQLSEHALLAVFTMQKGADGKPDFAPPGIAATLDANTVDLGNTIGSVYGDAAKDAFVKQWRDHIRMFVDFTVGTATKDDSKRSKALDELSQYKQSFAKFLTDNTGLEKDAGLKADAVAGLLQMHVDQLTGALDSYLGRK